MIPHGSVVYPDREGFIEQIQTQSTNWHRAGKALSQFLTAAFPQARTEAQELSAAIIALMTSGDDAQIKRLLAPQPMYSPYGPDPVSLMARLVKERDHLQEQIELAERGLESMRGNSKADGVADLLEAGTLGPLRGALVQLEEQISDVQKSMEEQEP